VQPKPCRVDFNGSQMHLDPDKHEQFARLLKQTRTHLPGGAAERGGRRSSEEISTTEGREKRLADEPELAQLRRVRSGTCGIPNVISAGKSRDWGRAGKRARADILSATYRPTGSDSSVIGHTRSPDGPWWQAPAYHVLPFPCGNNYCATRSNTTAAAWKSPFSISWIPSDIQ
jgi:hypothetical protein